MRRLVLVIGILAMLLAGCGVKLPDQINLPTQLTGGDPKTLEAATAADQERSDRYSSGDLAGAWLLSSRQFRDGITQSDYVTYIQTCKDPGLPVKVSGVRMDGDERAIVREELLGFKFSVTMVYEDGHWLRAPDSDFAASLGQPLDKLIASEKAAGRCLKDRSSMTAATTTPSPTATTTTPLPTCPTPGPGDEPQYIPPCTTAETTPTTPLASAETIDQMLANTGAGERPIVSGLHDQGYGYLNYGLVSQAWDRTCSLFGGAHGASNIAVADAKNELLEMRFTPSEADAIIGIALKVHGQPGIESCP